MEKHTLFSDLLTVLGVRHTCEYSCQRYDDMTFRTLFGLSHLLREYGIDSHGYRLSDTAEMVSIPVPFIAQTSGGPHVIVTGNDGDTVEYLSEGLRLKAPAKDFCGACTGVVLVPTVEPQACEPDFACHRFESLMKRARCYILAGIVGAILIYLFFANGVYDSVAGVLLTLLNLAGIGVSILLMFKTLGIKSRMADAVCGVARGGSCEDVLSTSASKFFGIFSWSEVGLGYFTVSLLALLIFPATAGWLALCNVCCLPYSFWSVWYQKFRVHSWCPLCLSVQTLLWLLFFSYLGGGMFAKAFPLGVGFFILLGCYVAAVLAINLLSSPFKQLNEEKQAKNHG